MPPRFDPNWEYFLPDPEVAELLAESAAKGRPEDSFRDLRAVSRGWNLGVQFGRRPADCFRGRLAPRRPGKDRVREEIPRAPCKGCGVDFQPDRRRRVYCSRGCVPHRGRARVLPDRRCAACAAPFRPRTATHVHCSPRCANEVRRKGTPQFGPSRCENCGAEVPPSASPNGQPRRFCKRTCKQAACTRRLRERKRQRNGEGS